MSLFRKIKQKAGITASNKLLSKKAEYALHEKVAMDLEKGEKNLGVWTAAFAKSEGDEKKAEAKYIELMVQYHKDQIAAGAELAEILEEEHEKDSTSIDKPLEDYEARMAREREIGKFFSEEARKRLKLQQRKLDEVAKEGQAKKL